MYPNSSRKQLADHLTHLSFVTELDLSGNGVSCEAAKRLLNSVMRLTSLQRLHLADNRIQQEAWDSLDYPISGLIALNFWILQTL